MTANVFSIITVDEAFALIRDKYGGSISLELLKAMLRNEELMHRYDLGFAIPINGESLRYVVYESKLLEYLENRTIEKHFPDPIKIKEE